MRKLKRSIIEIALAFSYILINQSNATGEILESSNANIEKWQKIAAKDIQRAQEIIKEAHPASLDYSNQDFHNWLYAGYEKALIYAQKSKSKDQAWAALNFYTTGFMDEHLRVWRDSPNTVDLHWVGWNMEYRNEKFLVVSAAEKWPKELPKIGDEVVSCDGLAIIDYLKRDIAPFVDRRVGLTNTLNKLAKYITEEQPKNTLWNSSRSINCEFKTPAGSRKTLEMHWEKKSNNQEIKNSIIPRKGIRQIEPHIYWIHISNFMLDAKDHLDFEALLNKIRMLSSADAVVLDTRGNSGGNSLIGTRLIYALLKESMPAQENSTALWRISSQAKATLESHRHSAMQTEGSDGFVYKFLSDLIESMKLASIRGENFVEQISTSIEKDKNSAKNTRPFKGKIVLITDSNCGSSCLNFVDEVMQIPGTLHVGNTTSADTRYTDVATVALPSGAKLWVPLKVWIGRRRQDNIPYVPEIAFDGDLNDTNALQAWILDSILPHAKAIGMP